MNIIVCIKQVPAKDAPLQIAGNWIREADIGFEMNEPDGFALEEALRLKEKHGGGGGAPPLGGGGGMGTSYDAPSAENRRAHRWTPATRMHPHASCALYT